LGLHASVPACGPAGNTATGRVYRFAPWALLLAEALVLTCCGIRARLPAIRIVVAVMGASAVTVAGGIVIFLLFFFAGGCYR
jgi:hypothetical protein